MVLLRRSKLNRLRGSIFARSAKIYAEPDSPLLKNPKASRRESNIPLGVTKHKHNERHRNGCLFVWYHVRMQKDFVHPALAVQNDKPLVYTAMSKHLFYYRMFISVFVLENGGVPLNPFMVFDYFLVDAIDRDLVREGNNNLVKRCDEIWVFGAISNGVLAEIQIAKEQGKTIRYFAIKKPHKIVETTKDRADMEPEVADMRHLL